MTTSRFETVQRFAVEIGEPSDAVLLYPTLSDGDLNIEMPMEHKPAAGFPFGGDVNALLIFDLDDRRTLCGIEVLLPETRWQHVERLPRLPEQVPAQTLRLLGNNVELAFEGPDPKFEYVSSADALVIAIEPQSASARWVGLSGECFAYVNDGFLGGFVTYLKDARV
jgi:hypothetical protein